MHPRLPLDIAPAVIVPPLLHAGTAPIFVAEGQAPLRIGDGQAVKLGQRDGLDENLEGAARAEESVPVEWFPSVTRDQAREVLRHTRRDLAFP